MKVFRPVWKRGSSDAYDKGLAQVKGLVNLTYLNLYGTLTKVSDEGIQKLKQALPGVNIDKGW